MTDQSTDTPDLDAIVIGEPGCAPERVAEQLAAYGVRDVHHVTGPAFDAYGGAAWASAVQSVRQTTGAVALSLILYLGIDGMVTMIPKIGEDIVHYMPFSALNTWIMDGDVAGAPWDSVTGSGLVFAVWALAAWIIGLVLLVKRDA